MTGVPRVSFSTCATIAVIAALAILGLTEDQLRGRTSLDPRWAALEALASDTKTTADKPAAKKRT